MDLAISSGKVILIKGLIQNGISLTNEQQSSIVKIYGTSDICDLIKEGHIDPNMEITGDKNKTTILSYLAKKDDFDEKAFKEIQAKIDPLAINSNGETILHLLLKGDNPNIKVAKLVLGSIKENEKIQQLSMLQDKDGNTIAHNLAASKAPQTSYKDFSTLLTEGALLSANNESKLPIDMMGPNKSLNFFSGAVHGPEFRKKVKVKQQKGAEQRLAKLEAQKAQKPKSAVSDKSNTQEPSSTPATQQQTTDFATQMAKRRKSIEGRDRDEDEETTTPTTSPKQTSHDHATKEVGQQLQSTGVGKVEDASHGEVPKKQPEKGWTDRFSLWKRGDDTKGKQTP